MKKSLTLLCFLSAFFIAAQAQTLQPLPAALQKVEPVNVFPENAGDGYVFMDRNKNNKPSTFSATKQNGAEFFTAEVLEATPSHFNIQTQWKNAAPIKRGDVLLARMNIRAVYAKQESGDAVVNFFVQQAVGERVVLLELRVGPEWKTIDVPFTSQFDMNTGEAVMGFTFGALAQKVEITNLQVLNFSNKALITQMPATRLTYAGREEGAAWRKEALKRIDEIRTAPLVVRVKDAKGKPVKGATVQARLVDPEFIWASAVSAPYMANDDSISKIYKRHILELFNAVTIGNHLKWGTWRDLKRREDAKKAMDWILANNLRLRGHNLVWPGRKFTPGPFNKMQDFGPSFSDTIRRHIKDIVTATKGKVYGWDVINEIMHEKDYFNVMPRTEAAEWFKLARQYDPGATLYINEYSMLNNVASPKNIQNYLAIIKELQGYGAPIDAIGVQGHVGRQPRDPVDVLSDLDMFKSTGLPVQITEFDINSPDEELQADYTRDFLIACYSHPVVDGFTMWGFWQSDHWKPDAAMYRKDWTPKPNAAEWKKLVLNEWRTNVKQTSEGNGEVTARGHFGKYEITVKKGKKVLRKTYQLTKDGKPLEVQL